ncbi:MAG: indole-3-glycerol phosphate synthase TrpC [Actinomycetota bacterium]|nr:indole-3-glycerol phosphate synthase TrpC [Actinomycetota bacterium]
MSLLDDIVSSTRARIEVLKSDDIGELARRAGAAPAPRGFTNALQTDGVAIIGEIKRASPSKGPLDPGLDAGKTAHLYAQGGASAISVLTEPDFFRGSLEDLEAAVAAGLPVLRKDFVLDGAQVLEARAAGADAVLLIVRILGEELSGLLEETRSLGMDALVEVYDESDVDIALGAGADLIGVNNRDLETFEVDPERTAKLAAGLPEDVLAVGLSGVSTRAEVEALEAAGARAVLIGESLVTAPDPAAKLRELLGS